MAVRSGAGTGAIVSLVILVILALGMLVLTIAFHAREASALEAKAEAQSTLARFIQPDQRQQDVFRRYEAAATSDRQSVAMYMHQHIENTMRYLDGNPGATLDGVKGRLSRFGVPADGVVATSLQTMHSDLRTTRDEIESLTARLERTDNELSQARAQLESLRASHREELASIQDQIAGYRQAADEYRDQLNEARRAMNEAVDRLNDRYANQIDEMQGENDDLNRQVVILEQRVGDLQERLSADRLRAPDPAMLASGRVIDVSPPDIVHINRGRRHRMVLGMTFEVYDDAAAIRVDERGNLSRGKASIQVTRVGEDSSTAKIIRAVPGRPVIRDNVIANAVYDPHHTFKFLVHGRFDIDGDGRATELEADYIRNLIREWGGEVVRGEQIPGDLDFLVLGVPPEEPPLLPDNPTPFMLEDWARKRQAQDTYNRLMREAQRAQIPILSHNRFLILIGHTHR